MNPSLPVDYLSFKWDVRPPQGSDAPLLLLLSLSPVVSIMGPRTYFFAVADK